MYDYNFFFSQIKNGYTRKRLHIEIIYTKKYLNLIMFLYKEGLINSFFINEKKQKIIIYFKYVENKCLLNTLKINNEKKKSLNIAIKVKKLKKLFCHGNFVCISTQRGLLTLSECFLYNIGGKILFTLI